MLKNIQLSIKKRGIEVLVLTLSAEKEDGTKVSRDLYLGGNYCSAARWGAQSVVDALVELDKPEVKSCDPLGHLETSVCTEHGPAGLGWKK